MHPRTRIKICGLRQLGDALCAAEAGADAVGFVFVKGSPRCVAPADVCTIVKQLPAFVEPVALFVNADADHVRAVCDQTGIRTVQLHGHESHEMVWQLSEFRIIKAINFGDAAQAHWLRSPVPGNVVGLLVDAPAKPQSNQLTGGSGEAFDWRALAALDRTACAIDRTVSKHDRASAPALILAGGLHAENVGEAIALVHPYAVDVSSGVESSRGTKDQAKIRAFCAAVHHADACRL